MRWINLTIIVVFAAAAIILAFQNLETVTVSFLSFSVSAPLAIFIFGIYLLGAATGGSLFALLRRSYQGSREARSALLALIGVADPVAASTKSEPTRHCPQADNYEVDGDVGASGAEGPEPASIAPRASGAP